MHVVAAGLVALFVGSSVVPAPSDLISVIDGPEGYELADTQSGLTFDEYAELEPDAVAHIDGAADMTASIDVWTSETDDIVLRQVTRWGDADEASAYVAQADTVAQADGLESRAALFESGIEYIGDDANGIVTHLIAWSQGRLAISVEVFSLGADRTDTLHEQAESFAAEITRATGIDTSADGAVTPDDAPSTPTETTGGGIPIGKVLLWLVIIVGGIWLFVTLRKKLRAITPASDRSSKSPADATPAKNNADGPMDVDDVIERARAESRARREVEEASGPELGEEWKIPDDY